jgi:lipoprotein-anchoring transpeptidase ErfK/SrfK
VTVVSALVLWLALTAKAQQVPAQPALPPAAQEALRTQVMLDRAGFSPGEIDAAMGLNTRKALDAFKKSSRSAPERVEPVVAYTISDQDAAGPFTPDIPTEMMDLAQLPALGYRDVLESLAERFHSSPKLLKRLNPGKTFVPGDQLLVPNVQAMAAPTEQDANKPVDVTVTVTKSTSSLVVTDASGQVVFYAPVTTGSEHDPLPIGEWKVNGVQRNPSFHYNPALFWDAETKDEKATIPPGPNNPVGVVWIDISRPHYGLHGTAEPSTIGRTESHGCVRLTNWDALTVASLVRPGTRVIFTP